MSRSPETEGPNKLGTMLKELMKQHNLSMRKTSSLTQIDTATISRIVNGKQAARTGHLQKFAEALQVPLHQLLEAAGLEIRQPPEHGLKQSLDSIQEMFAANGFFNGQDTTRQVEQALSGYEEYAQTSEAQRMIHDGFRAKILQVDGAGPFIDRLEDMYAAFCNKQTSAMEKKGHRCGTALFYLVSRHHPGLSVPDRLSG